MTKRKQFAKDLAAMSTGELQAAHQNTLDDFAAAKAEGAKSAEAMHYFDLQQINEEHGNRKP